MKTCLVHSINAIDLIKFYFAAPYSVSLACKSRLNVEQNYIDCSCQSEQHNSLAFSVGKSNCRTKNVSWDYACIHMSQTVDHIE